MKHKPRSLNQNTNLTFRALNHVCSSKIKKSNLFFSDNRRKVESSICFKRFGIKLFSRAAIKTCAICSVSLHKRTADIFVPASEELSHDADLLSENAFVNSVCSFFV